ncbi:MAG: hypothetical protein AAB505_01030 [Patescibacteria group bacterium]
MVGFRLIKDYFFWHYGAALGAGWRIYGNLLWFLFHFFSVSLLLRTLFSPWRRLAEPYTKGFAPTKLVETLIVNVLMRLVGLLIRLVLISFAVVVLALAVALGPVGLIVWLISPALILFCLVTGFYLIFWV